VHSLLFSSLTNFWCVKCAALVLALENLQASSGAAPGTTSGSKKSPAPEACHLTFTCPGEFLNCQVVLSEREEN
jgi:hypothetical protein